MQPSSVSKTAGNTAGKTVIIDLEVQSHPYHGEVGSPRHPENYVVASGWAELTGPTQGLYFLEAGHWAPYLDDPELSTLVAHNAPFEIDWLMTYHRPEFLAFLKRGGRVFCTAYAHYLLSNQQDTYPSLNDIAPLYGGTPKVDAVKLLWDRGVLTSDIDKHLLFDEYLLGPDGDIENTRKVYLQQLQQLQERGMLVQALERMHGMVFNAMCMHNGLMVDRDLAEEHMQDQVELLGKLQQTLDEFLQVPAEVLKDFNQGSQFHLSAVLYGGSIPYRQRVPRSKPDGTPIYVKGDFLKLAKPAEGQQELIPYDPEGVATLEELEALHGPLVRFKAGKNKGSIKVFREDTAEVDTKWEDTYAELPGLIDLNAMPEAVRKSWLEDFEQQRTMRCGTTVKGTSADALEALAVRPEYREVRPCIMALLTRAKVVKDRSSFYLVQELDDAGEVKKVSGMLQYQQPTGLIHPSLNCTSTVTTRLSCTRPNMQQLSRGDSDPDIAYESRVKELFISRFPEGRILGIDFSNLETYVLADLSKDPALSEALLQGTDMHCLRLAGQLKEPYEEVLKKCKDKQHPEYSRYDAMRTAIKPKSFAYAYGASAAGIAYATGSSVEDAQAFIDAERALFPRVEEYFDELMQIVEQNVSRHREEVGEGRFRLYSRGRLAMPCGTTFEFRSWPKRQWVNGQPVETMQFKPTQLRNYPVQGTAAELVQVVAAQITRWLVQSDLLQQFRVLPIMQVHDCYLFDCATEADAELASATVLAVMQQACVLMNRLGYNFSMPYKGDASFGLSMADA